MSGRIEQASIISSITYSGNGNDSANTSTWWLGALAEDMCVLTVGPYRMHFTDTNRYHREEEFKTYRK